MSRERDLEIITAALVEGAATPLELALARRVLAMHNSLAGSQPTSSEEGRADTPRPSDSLKPANELSGAQTNRKEAHAPVPSGAVDASISSGVAPEPGMAGCYIWGTREPK